MNELTETWVVVKPQGGMPVNWLYKEVDGKRIFAARQARELLKGAGPDWQMLHATGLYHAEDFVGDPTHPAWGTSLPEYPGIE